MSVSFRLFIVTCFVFFVGCREESRLPGEKAPEKELPKMVQIQNFTITDEALTLDYRVTNIFEEGIWVCYDTWVHGTAGVQNVITRIDGKTVLIKLSFNYQRTPGFVNPPAIAKYIRLSPGESCSGRILRNLPIRDYLREWRAEHKEHKDIVLHQLIFEIGYIRSFGPKWNALIDSWAKKMEEGSIESKPRVLGPYPYYHLPVNPLITEETLDGQLRKVMYLREHTSIEKKEEFGEVLTTDVNIPCSVVDDDE